MYVQRKNGSRSTLKKANNDIAFSNARPINLCICKKSGIYSWLIFSSLTKFFYIASLCRCSFVHLNHQVAMHMQGSIVRKNDRPVAVVCSTYRFWKQSRFSIFKTNKHTNSSGDKHCVPLNFSSRLLVVM